MEDAMIINKSSYERGFAAGCIYKTEFIELKHVDSYFCRNPQLPLLAKKLDPDGLPHPGTKLTKEDPLYCYYNIDESKYYVEKFKSKEDAYVDNVRLCGSFNSKQPKVACIVFRIPVSTTRKYILFIELIKSIFREIRQLEINSHQEQDKKVFVLKNGQLRIYHLQKQV